MEPHAPTMLDNLSRLASFHRPVRLEAAVSLLGQLAAAQGAAREPCADLLLTVERVTFGLASGREGSRQGFSVVLTEVLASMPMVTVNHVLEIVRTKMDPVGEKGDAEKQCFFGRIFAINCLIRSGRLASLPEQGRPTVLKECFELLTSSEKKSYMKELVTSSIIDLIGLMRNVDELKEIALPLIQHLIDVAPDECTPESLALLLILNELYGSGVVCPAVSISISDSRFKSAVLASSYTHPRQHFMWAILQRQVFASEGSERHELWSIIDSLLFGSHVDNRKFLAFTLLLSFVSNPRSSPTDVLSYLEQPNTLRSLMNHAASGKVTKMSDMASRVVESLKERVTGGDQAGAQLGRALLDAKFLAPLGLDLQLVGVLDAKTGLEYVRSLLTPPFTKELGERITSAMKRGWRKWVAESDVDKSALAELASQCTRAFADAGFLAKDEEERQWGHQRLMTLLSELESTGHANVLELCQWVSKKKQKTSSSSDESYKALLKRSLRGARSSSDRYEQAFGKVVGLVAFVNLDNGDIDAEAAQANLSLWEDAVTAQKEFGAAKEKSRAVLVLVSVMIELLTQPSAFVRSVVVGSFRLIAPMIPERGIRDICAAILASDNEAAGKGGDDEEEGDNDDDDDDDDNDNDEDDAEDEDNGSARKMDEDSDSNEDIPQGVQLPDIALEDADPEYLNRVEESLANVFRAMQEQRGLQGGSTAASGKKKVTSASLDFKLRVVDLLDHFVHSLSRMASMESLPFESKEAGDNRSVVFKMLPLILGKLKKIQYSKKLKPLYDKLERVVLKRVCEIREWPSMAGHGKVLGRALAGVLHYASRGNPSQAFTKLVSRTTAVLVKVMQKENLSPMVRVHDSFEKVITFCGSKKNLRVLDFEQFFIPIWTRVPEAGVALLPLMAECSSKQTWMPRARLSCLTTVMDFLMRSGKSYFMSAKGNADLLPSFHNVERVFLGWLRCEETVKSKPQVVQNAVTAFRDILTKILCDDRFSSGGTTRSNVYRHVLSRDELCAYLKRIVGKKSNTKLAVVVDDLQALLKTAQN